MSDNPTLPNFVEVLRESEAKLARSNLENLAHAHVMISEDIVRLKDRIAKLKGIQADIVNLGSKSNKDIHASAVKTLYDRAMKSRG